MGMFGYENSYEGDHIGEMGGVESGDGRHSRPYQSTGEHKADNAADTAGFIPSTPTPDIFSPDDSTTEPDVHEYPYLTPSPESSQKQSPAFTARSVPPRSRHIEPATSPSTHTQSNEYPLRWTISPTHHISIPYDPKDGLTVFWAVEQVKTRYAQHLGVETLTSRHREEVVDLEMKCYV